MHSDAYSNAQTARYQYADGTQLRLGCPRASREIMVFGDGDVAAYAVPERGEQGNHLRGSVILDKRRSIHISW